MKNVIASLAFYLYLSYVNGRLFVFMLRQWSVKQNNDVKINQPSSRQRPSTFGPHVNDIFKPCHRYATIQLSSVKSHMPFWKCYNYEM